MRKSRRSARRSVVAALCVVAALGASVSVPAAAERTTWLGAVIETLQSALTRMAEDEREPLSGPIPSKKPDTKVTEKAAPTPALPDVETVAQCGYASIIATPAADGAQVYSASFADGMIDDLAGKGCGLILQGCNTCSVLYLGCSAAERAACTDIACLEKTCERQVRCTAKTCTVEGKAPSCESRIARARCGKSIY